MKNRRDWLCWSPLPVSAAAQAVAAMADYTGWKEILPSQTTMLGITTFAVLPVLAAGVFISWLLSFCFGFTVQDHKVLLMNSVKAKMLYYGTLIGLISIFSLLGGMMTWSSDFPWGYISLSCLLVLPLALAFTYEYRGCRKLLPGTSEGHIAAYLVVASVLAVAAVILLAIVSLLILHFVVKYQVMIRSN